MINAACRVYVSGIVQGVGFRYATKQQAEQLELAGRVENLSDGRVHVYAEGSMSQLQNLVDWLEQGPTNAHVSAITVEWLDSQGIEEFAIL